MRGKRIKLSIMRRFVGDLVRAARQIPSIPVQRRIQIGEVVTARAICNERPPWPVIFMKAYALVCRQMPELRRAYVKFPWPHLYEYPVSVASMAVERDHEGEAVVFIGKIKDPGSQSLAQLSQLVRSMRVTPLEQLTEFRRIRTITRLPWPLRRMLWWLAMNIGRQRGNFLGTFGISVYSSLGAESLHPLSPTTSLLNYDRISSDGTVNVRIVYDHRVLDGATIARALAKLELVLADVIKGELEGMASLPAADPPALKRAI